MDIFDLYTWIEINSNGIEIFNGNRKQFMDCFFSNATDENIKCFCAENNWELKINGQIIIIEP